MRIETEKLFDNKFEWYLDCGAFDPPIVKAFIDENFIAKKDLEDTIEGMKKDLTALPPYKEKYRHSIQEYNKALQDLKDKLLPEMHIDTCDKCVQTTNHNSKGECLKCK